MLYRRNALPNDDYSGLNAFQRYHNDNEMLISFLFVYLLIFIDLNQ